MSLSQAQIDNAGLDTEFIGSVANGSATADGDGTATNRLGAKVKTIARIVSEIEDRTANLPGVMPFHESLAEARAGLAVGTYFTSTDVGAETVHTGELRTYKIEAGPVATDQGDIAAPLNPLNVVRRVGATAATLLATIGLLAVGSFVQTSDGHVYEVMAGASDLTTVTGSHLRVVPDRKGWRHFEAMAPELDGAHLTAALAWAAGLPDDAKLWVAGNYTISATFQPAHRLEVDGTGSLAAAGGAGFTLVQPLASKTKWRLKLDGNKALIVSGSQNLFYVTGLSEVTFDAEAANSYGNGLLINASPDCVVGPNTHVHDCWGTGILVMNGSDRFRGRDGARVKYCKQDCWTFTDNTGNPCLDPQLGKVEAAYAGYGNTGYWCGIRFRYCIGGGCTGSLAYGCLGSGFAVQAASGTPSRKYSKNVNLVDCTGHHNNDGAILDDYCRDCHDIGGKYFKNINDAIDNNYTMNCHTIGTSGRDNGEKGILMWGSQYALAIGCNVVNCNYTEAAAYSAGQNYVLGDKAVVVTVVGSDTLPIEYAALQATLGNAPPAYPTISNAYWTMTSDPQSAGVYVSTNTNSGAVPFRCRIIECTLTDDRTTTSLNYDAKTVDFTVGNTVTGAGGATGTIERIFPGVGTTGRLELSGVTGTFVDNEALTGSGGGAATVNGVAYSSKTQRFAIRFVNGTEHDAVANEVRNNVATAPINDATGSVSTNLKRGNKGFKTEADVTVTITGGTTSAVASTGIAATGMSAVSWVSCAPTRDLGAGNQWWLSTFTATGFTVNMTSALAGSTAFNCGTSVYPRQQGL